MPQVDYDHLDGVSLVGQRYSNVARTAGLIGLGVLMITGLVYVNWPTSRVVRSGVPSDSPAGDEQFQLPAFPVQRPVLPQAEPPTPAETVTVAPEPPDETMPEMPEPAPDADAEQQRRDLEQQMRDDEANRLAQEESDRQARAEREQAERDAKLERIQSDQMVTDDPGGTPQSDQNALTEGGDNQVVQVPGADSDPNKAFLAQSEQNHITPAVATRNARPDALIAQGTLIRGFLETAINSDLPGMVRAVVRENVYSLDGRRVLVPKGSRLVGEYKSGLSRGQTRVFVVWNRIVMSDGTQVDIASPGADSIGRAGLTGRVDTHWGARVGNALFFSVLGSAAQIGTALAFDDDNGRPRTITTTDPATGIITTTTIDPSGSGHEGVASAVSQGTNGFTQLATESSQNAENIPPTVHVDQGSDVVVFVRRDLDFSKLYADPLKEELRRLKQQGNTGGARASSQFAPRQWYPPRPAYK